LFTVSAETPAVAGAGAELLLRPKAGKAVNATVTAVSKAWQSRRLAGLIRCISESPLVQMGGAVLEKATGISPPLIASLLIFPIIFNSFRFYTPARVFTRELPLIVQLTVSG